MSDDRAREEIAAALAGRWLSYGDHGDADDLTEHDDRDGARIRPAHARLLADALLPTVRALMAEAAAKALEEAAEDLRQRGVGPEVFVVDDRAAACRARALTAHTEETKQ